MSTLAPRTRVRLPHGEEGTVTHAPANDWLAPGSHEADVAGLPVVWVEWRGYRSRTYGCWWRPDALNLVTAQATPRTDGATATRERTRGGHR